MDDGRQRWFPQFRHDQNMCNIDYLKWGMVSKCYIPSVKNDRDPHNQNLGLIQNKIWSIDLKTRRRRGVCCTRLLNESLFNFP